MYQAIRKIHLWVGLFLALFILIEAITGLLLEEPWLAGQASPQKPPAAQQHNLQRDNTKGAPLEGVKPRSSGGIIPLAKGLHQGRLGNLDFKWLVDITAIGLVVLTLTGIYISIPILRASNRKH